jgi:hypothetical protein
MGDLFTTCFGPKGASPGLTYIKITKNGYWVMIVFVFVFKGSWAVYR